MYAGDVDNSGYVSNKGDCVATSRLKEERRDGQITFVLFASSVVVDVDSYQIQYVFLSVNETNN